MDAFAVFKPDAAMRARMNALNPPVTAAKVAATADKGAKLLLDACKEGDVARAWQLIELGAGASDPGVVWQPDGLMVAAVESADDAGLVALLAAAHGAAAAADGAAQGSSNLILRHAKSTAVMRALLALGCKLPAPTAASPQEPLVLTQFNSPAALRVLVEEGGADACLELPSLPVHAGTTPVRETLLALAVARGVPLSAAVNARSPSGASALPQARNSAASTALLLACGADVCGDGTPPVLDGGFVSPNALRVILAHAAAVLPGTRLPPAFLVHARDSPYFTGRVAEWEDMARESIRWEHDYATEDSNLTTLTETQRAQRVLLVEEVRQRRLAALEEDLAAWAWARGVVAAAIDATQQQQSPPPMTPTTTRRKRPTLAAWINARDRRGYTALTHALQSDRNCECALPLLAYGARIDVGANIKQMLREGPEFLRAALIDYGAATSPGYVLDRACVVSAAAFLTARSSWLGSYGPKPDPAALVAAFDDCLRVRVKRISAGMKGVVPLPAHSTHNAPLDIVSEYLGFSLVVGPLATAPPAKLSPFAGVSR